MKKMYLDLLKEQAIFKKVIREQDEDSMELKSKIKKFFRDNPNPDDSKVHELADRLNMNPHDLETKIYEILTVFVNLGKHQDDPDSKFDSKELAMGIDVEKEHTDCPMLAKEIAKDHLAEIPDYYTRLKKMEDEGKKESGIKDED